MDKKNEKLFRCNNKSFESLKIVLHSLIYFNMKAFWSVNEYEWLLTFPRKITLLLTLLFFRGELVSWWVVKGTMSTWGNHGQNLDYWLNVQVDSYKKVILYTLNSLGMQSFTPTLFSWKVFFLSKLSTFVACCWNQICIRKL